MPAKKKKPASSARKSASPPKRTAETTESPAVTANATSGKAGKAAARSLELCGAEIAGRFTCDRDADHEGRHGAPSIDDPSARVSWAEGSLGYRED